MMDTPYPVVVLLVGSLCVGWPLVGPLLVGWLLVGLLLVSRVCCAMSGRLYLYRCRSLPLMVGMAVPER